MTTNPEDSQDAVDLADRVMSFENWKREAGDAPLPVSKWMTYAEVKSALPIMAQAVLSMQERIREEEDRLKLVRRFREIWAERAEKAEAQVTALRTALENLMAWADAQNNWDSLTVPPEFVAAAKALSATPPSASDTKNSLEICLTTLVRLCQMDKVGSVDMEFDPIIDGEPAGTWHIALHEGAWRENMTTEDSQDAVELARDTSELSFLPAQEWTDRARILAQVVIDKQEREPKLDGDGTLTVNIEMAPGQEVVVERIHLWDTASGGDAYYEPESQVTALRTALEDMKSAFKRTETVEQLEAVVKADAALSTNPPPAAPDTTKGRGVEPV